MSNRGLSLLPDGLIAGLDNPTLNPILPYHVVGVED